MTGSRDARARARLGTSSFRAIESSRLRLVGVALVCTKVALIPIVFDHAADSAFPVPKALLSHAIAYGLAAVMVGLGARFGRSVIVRSWMHIPVIVFLAANLIATVFAPDPLVALYGTHARMLGLNTVADFVVTYFAFVVVLRTRTDWIAVISSGLVASVVVLAYEFVQLIGRDPFDWNIGTSVRPFSTLGQTTTLAEYLTVLAVGAVGIALFDEKLRVSVRSGLLFYTIFLIAGILITQTRSALVGIVAGAAVLVSLTWLGHPSRRARVTSVAAAGVAAIAISVVLLFTPLGARMLTTFDAPGTDVSEDPTAPRVEESANTRLGLYEAAARMLAARPIFGYGPDNFAAAFPRHRTAAEPAEIQQSLPTSAHSWAAQSAATAGLAGLAAFVAIATTAVVLTVKGGFQVASWVGAGMIATFLGVAATTVSDVGTDWLFWACAGGVAAATARRSSRRVANEPVSKRTRMRVPRTLTIPGALAAVCAVLAFAAILASGNAYSASRYARESQQQRLAGQAQGAIASGLRATSLDPGRPDYWDTLGLAYVSGLRLADATSAFDRAASLEPYNFRYLGDLASAYLLLTQRGDASSGIRARDVAERAVRADPNNPQASLIRATVMQATGDLPEALRSVQLALVLDPQSTNDRLYVVAAQVMLDGGRWSDAISVARRGIAIIGPTNSSVAIRFELARALVAGGQPLEALNELDLALSIQPSNVRIQQLRSQIQSAVPK